MSESNSISVTCLFGSVALSLSGSIGPLHLTERQQAVLMLITENTRITHREIADALGINPSAVQKHLAKLKEAGAIERMGGTRGSWRVNV